jgi:hypothetical protein
VANKPGMPPVQTTWPQSKLITSPGYFRFMPVDFGLYIKDPEELAYRAKIPYEDPVNMTFDVSNLYAECSVDMESTIEIIDSATGEQLWGSGPEVATVPPLTHQWPWWDIHVIHTCLDFGWSYFHVEDVDYPLYKICYHKYIWMHINGYIAITLLGDPIVEFDWWIPVFIHIKVCFWIPLDSSSPGAPCTIFGPWDFELSWSVIKEDIAGSTWYDQAQWVNMTTGEPIYPFTDYPYKKQLPTPDGKVDMKDIGRAAKAFGSYPGHARWDSVSDINHDYKVDMKDIGGIARYFGWKC